MGYGKLGKKYGKRRRRTKIRRKRGIKPIFVVNHETGSTNTSPDCCYAGHAMAMSQYSKAIWSALVLKLAQKAGLETKSINQRWRSWGAAAHAPDIGRIVITWKIQENVPTRTPFTLVETATLHGTMTAIEAAMTTTFFAGNDPPEFLKMELYTYEFTGTAPTRTWIPAAQIDLSRCLISTNFTSKMALQNRTRGLAATDQSALDVTANPLRGRSYQGNGTGARLRFNNNTVSLTTTLGANTTTGAITFNLEGVNVTNEMKDYLRHPPSTNAFTNTRSSSKVVLAPGEIKMSYLSYNKTEFLNHLFKKIGPYYSANAATVNNCGKFKLYAVEKACNTRISEPDSVLGFEIETKYAIGVSQKAVRCVTHQTESNTGAL